MTSHSRNALVLSLVLAAAVAGGCGGGSQGSSSQATSAPSGTTEAQREQAALPTRQMRPVPKDIGCTGDDVVWVNTNTKSYHEPSDPFYGRTKNGTYMCKAAADAAGYHLAGSSHSHHTRGMGGSGGSSPADDSTPSDSGT
jgi:hypothetical protein